MVDTGAKRQEACNEWIVYGLIKLPKIAQFVDRDNRLERSKVLGFVPNDIVRKVVLRRCV